MCYTRANRLQRAPNQSLQLAVQLVQRRTSQLTTVVLISSRWNMLGGRRLAAAATGKASKAWLAGPDAIMAASLHGLQQEPKQLYPVQKGILKGNNRATAGSFTGKKADASCQQEAHHECLPQEQQQKPARQSATWTAARCAA